MSLRVDLNADLDEGAGRDAELLALVSSANIACGMHAGDPTSMAATLSAAREHGVAVGAHPGFADREHFGRRELQLSAEEVFALVVYQVGAFSALARVEGLRPRHVKPHGALYNMAARDPGLAETVVRAIAACGSSLRLFAPPRSALAAAGEAHGLVVMREFFADRNYLPDGMLVPRSQAQALVHDPEEAAKRVLRVLTERKVAAVDGTEIEMSIDTVCLHGDSPEAMMFARTLRSRLLAAGVKIGAARD